MSGKYRRILAAIATAVATLGIATAAHASQVSYDGATLVLTGTGGSDDLYVSTSSEGPSGTLRLDASDAISHPDGSCSRPADAAETGDTSVYCTYDLAAGVRVMAGAGNDSIVVYDVPASLPFLMSGGEGDDQIRDAFEDSAVTRTLDGGPGKDFLQGHGGSEHLIGGPGDDRLEGGGGADELRGGEDNDNLNGDGFESAASDILDGGAGVDTVDRGWDIPSQSPKPAMSVTQDGVADDGRPGERDNVTSIERIDYHVSGTYHGTAGDDDFKISSRGGGGGRSTIIGGDGNDRLESFEHVETLDGGAGDDTIIGGWAGDTLIGGPGRDTIVADDPGYYCGPYGCTGAYGNDRVEARDGEIDTIDCGVGTDVVIADAVDTVAETCETVDRGAPGTDPVRPPVRPHPVDPVQPFRMTVLGAPTLRLLKSNGLTLELSCASACEATATLSLDRRSARRARLRATSLGGARKALLDAGTMRLTIKPSAAVRRRLGRLRAARVTLVVTARDGAGETTVRRQLALRR